MHCVVSDNKITENNSEKSLKDRFHNVGLINVFMVDKTRHEIIIGDCLYSLKFN